MRERVGKPATEPGTPVPSPLSRHLRRIGLAGGVQEHVGGRGGRRGLAVIQRDVLSIFPPNAQA